MYGCACVGISVCMCAKYFPISTLSHTLHYSAASKKVMYVESSPSDAAGGGDGSADESDYGEGDSGSSSEESDSMSGTGSDSDGESDVHELDRVVHHTCKLCGLRKPWVAQQALRCLPHIPVVVGGAARAR